MTTKRFATRDFNDAGTGRSFKAGEELTNLTAGTLVNYEHAGLAGDQPGKASAPAKAPAKRTAKARPKKVVKAATALAFSAPIASTNTDKAPVSDA